MKIVLVSNMYPDEKDPAKGIFVKNIKDNLSKSGVDVKLKRLVNTRGKFRLALAYLRFYAEVFLTYQRENASQIFYIHYTSHCALPFLLATWLGNQRTIVSHVHGSDVLPESGTTYILARMKIALSKRLLVISRYIIVPSPYYRDILHQRYGIPMDRIRISPSGGVNLSVFKPGEKPTTRSSDTSLRLGFVGRMVEEKGILDFLEVVDILRGRGYHIEGEIVGDGPLREVVKEKASGLGLQYHCGMPQEQLQLVYSNLDLFIFPTKRKAESLGLVGLEAMACGSPVVAYSGSGPETYIEPKKNGFLAEISDVSSLATKVEDYVALSIEEKLAMRDAAISTAQSYCSKQVHSQLLLTLQEALS